MIRERASAKRMEARKPVASERDLRKAFEAREVKELGQLRVEILKRAKPLLKDSGIRLRDDKGPIQISPESEERRMPAKTVEGFDLEALAGHPEFRTETRRVGSIEYVMTERIKDRSVVRPDGHGRYPHKEDLDAALKHDYFLAMRWVAKDGIPPEQAALIAHHHHKKPKEWLDRALEALLASEATLTPDEAMRRAATVINDLIDAHRKRAERL